MLGDRTLKFTYPYMKGDDVKELQNLLNKYGFDCGTADGVFGSKTDKAVVNFQSAVGIISDGVVGSDTLKALRNYTSETKDAIESVRNEFRKLFIAFSDDVEKLASYKALKKALEGE